jgi:hypothetical protein
MAVLSIRRNKEENVSLVPAKIGSICSKMALAKDARGTLGQEIM